MKKPVVKQVEEITAEFKAEVLVPQEWANVKFAASTPELTQKFGSLARSTLVQSPQRGAMQQARAWR